MLKIVPSLQKPVAEYYSGDPAFRQLAKSATTKERKDHDKKLGHARETGDYSKLLIGGHEPTVFMMKPIGGDQFRRLATIGQRQPLLLLQLAFRCAIHEITNAGELDVKFHDDTVYGLGVIADVAVTDALDEIDPRIVNELGGLALNRSGGPSPHR